MATSREPTPRRRPILVFGGAAVLVLLGAAIPLLIFGLGDGGPAATTTPMVSEPPVVDTTAPATETTAPSTVTTEPSEETTVTTLPPTAEVDTTVFLVQDPEDSVNGNPTLVAYRARIEAPHDAESQMRGTLQELAADITPPMSGVYTLVPGGVEILDVTLEQDHLVVEVNEAFRAGTGGLVSDMTMLSQLVYTATQNGDVGNVMFLIDGEPIVDFGTDGLDISDGVGRETFRDSLSSVIVTQPVVLGGDDLPQVEGIANVFEATVSLDIVDASGEVVYQDFTTATCGTGCWGDFVFTLDTPLLTEDSLVRVFWNSPRDGAPSDVVTIPVTAAGAWDLTPDE